MNEQNSSANGSAGPKPSNNPKKSIIAWALYDSGNSAFATTVMAAFFPIFFKQYWSSGVDVTMSTFNLGLANSIASVILAISAPLIGAIADRGSNRKKFLIVFTCLGIIMTGGLYFVQMGAWPIAVLLYVLGTIGFAGANVFYDSLLILITAGKKLDFVSALGYSMGYLGGSLLYSLNAVMVLKPEWFGLESAAEAIKVSFITVAVWWALFSIPLILFVKEPQEDAEADYSKAVKAGWRQLIDTFKHIKTMKALWMFLLAYIFYIDAVNTLIKMAVDYGLSLGFETNNLLIALAITNWVAFPAALAFGFFGEKFGAKRGIYVALGIYIVVSTWGITMTHVYEFYVLAAAIGLVQGGIQSLSRSYYASMIPQDKPAEYFGFFNMVGKFSAIFGPVLVGWVSVTTGDPRMSILVIVTFFVIGWLLLLWHSRIKKQEAL